MNTIARALLPLALLAAFAARARADLLPVLLIVSPEGNGFRWTYTVQATTSSSINPGDSFTFGDFAGLVPGSAAGARPLRETAQGPPVRCRHAQFGQCLGQPPGRIPGHRRQPARQGSHLAGVGYARLADAQVAAQVAGVQALPRSGPARNRAA